MRIIDTYVNIPLLREQLLVERFSPAVARWFHDRAELITKGTTWEYLIGEMDEAGVEKALVVGRDGSHHPSSVNNTSLGTTHGIDDEIFDMFAEEMATAVQKYPDRIAATVLIDPLGGMKAVWQLERAVRDYGFVAARIFAARIGIPFNHPLCFPIYTKCIELNIPITLNLGTPGPRRPARVQEPILLEDVLLAYPELTVVGTHIGMPWHHQTVALLQKFENFYLSTAGYAPKYTPPEILHFMNTRGKEKVMWASDYPLLSPARTAEEGKALPLKDEARTAAYMGGNAAKVFKL